MQCFHCCLTSSTVVHHGVHVINTIITRRSSVCRASNDHFETIFCFIQNIQQRSPLQWAPRGCRFCSIKTASYSVSSARMSSRPRGSHMHRYIANCLFLIQAMYTRTVYTVPRYKLAHCVGRYRLCLTSTTESTLSLGGDGIYCCENSYSGACPTHSPSGARSNISAHMRRVPNSGALRGCV